MEYDQMNFRIRQLSHTALVLFGMVWAIVVVTGLLLLYEYQTTAGPAGNPVTNWPPQSGVIPVKDRAQIVMVVHPRCACTRASLEALARIMAHAQDRVVASVLFLTPRGVPAGWEHTDLWRTAAAIPDVRVFRDHGGVEASRFGLETSGHLLLFNRDGRRVFGGGITAGRGHHGDNAGLEHCLSLINGERREPPDTPVFGCPLRDPSKSQFAGAALCRKTN